MISRDVNECQAGEGDIGLLEAPGSGEWREDGGPVECGLNNDSIEDECDVDLPEAGELEEWWFGEAGEAACPRTEKPDGELWQERAAYVPSDSRSDEDLYLAYKCGDSEALGILAGRWGDPIKRIIAKGFGAGVADDVLQETILVMMQTNSYKQDEGRFKSWIMMIAWNKAKEILRREQQRAGRELRVLDRTNDEGDALVAVFDNRTAPDPVLSAVKAEQHDRLLQALEELLFERDEPVGTAILRYFEGLEHHEIADRLGIPNGTARRRTFDALKLIRERIRLSDEEYYGG